jgi:hypothetical protein
LHRKIEFPQVIFQNGLTEKYVLSLILAVLLITFLVAWFSPPMTWDSLSYHLSRIVHWVQNKSVWHYMTGIERQNSFAPGSEFLTLNIFLLIGSDRFAAFTEWFSMLGSLVGVSLLAKQLGVNKLGQLFSVLFAATVPMGIVQASSTISDYVVTLWVICMFCEVFEFSIHKHSGFFFYFGLSAGLIILTKLTALPFLLFASLYVGIIIFRQRNTALRLFSRMLLSFILALILCLGYITRNIVTYGGLSNPDDFQGSRNFLLTPIGITSNIIKNMALHAGLPNNDYNARLFELVRLFHVKYKLDMNDPRTTGVGQFDIGTPTTIEDLTSSPYHAYLIVIGVLYSLFFLKQRRDRTYIYMAIAILGFLTLCGFYKWNIHNVRYHLIFFIGFAPIAGDLVSLRREHLYSILLGTILFITSIPWLLSIATRPLIPLKGYSDKPSIVFSPDLEKRFSNCPECLPPLVRISNLIRYSDCHKIGLHLTSNDGEYYVWSLFSTPNSAYQLEWVSVSTASNKYQISNFEPCAIICHSCDPGLRELGGLKLEYTTGDLQLFK